MEKCQAHHRQRFLAHRTVHLTPDWVSVAFETVLVVAAVELHSVVNDFVAHSTLEICFVANTKNGCIVPRHSLFRFWGKCAQKSDLLFYREAIWTVFPGKILLFFWRFVSKGEFPRVEDNTPAPNRCLRSNSSPFTWAREYFRIAKMFRQGLLSRASARFLGYQRGTEFAPDYSIDTGPMVPGRKRSKRMGSFFFSLKRCAAKNQ